MNLFDKLLKSCEKIHEFNKDRRKKQEVRRRYYKIKRAGMRKYYENRREVMQKDYERKHDALIKFEKKIIKEKKRKSYQQLNNTVEKKYNKQTEQSFRHNFVNMNKD